MIKPLSFGFAVAGIGKGRMRAGALVLRESDIQNTCEDLLEADQWRIFRLEQNYSERKVKLLGEPGAPDCMAVRYSQYAPQADILFIEWKRLDKRGKPTKATAHQKAWHALERARGALTLIAGIDFAATPEGFFEWYAASGLARNSGASRRLAAPQAKTP